MPIITIKVIPNAKETSITEEKGILKLRVKAPAVDNKANKAVISALSEHFNINKGKIRILKGEKSREKTIELLD